MIKAILVALFLIVGIQSQCREGCLRCDIKRNKCLFCDISLNYRTLKGQCIKTVIDNCLFISSDGNCLKCAQNYFLDTNTLRCIALPEESIIAQCEEYLSLEECRLCTTGFYPKNNTCLKVNSLIVNCNYYLTETKCLSCAKGFVMKVDQASCVTINASENCSSYTQIRCATCKDGFIQNQNLFLKELFDFKNYKGFEKAHLRIKELADGNYDGNKISTCEKINVTNCVSFKTFDTCDVCADGYFLKLDKKTCQKYPNPVILNCKAYSALNVCIDCAIGFFVKSATECAAVTPVQNCQVYSTSASSTVCVKCLDTFFLPELNKCIGRSILVIQGCGALSLTSETCETCNTGLLQTSDRLRCFPVIPNCQTYENSSQASTSLVCSVCNPGYFYDLNSKLCNPGSTEQCDIYSKNANTCIKCKNKFYLVNNKCLAHADLPDCDSYSNLTQDVCDTCNSRSYRFAVNNICVNAQPISNCVKYASTSTCSVCEDGYVINNTLTCSQIPLLENCLNKVGTLCTKCLPYYILESGVCREPLNYLVHGCQTFNIDGTLSYSAFNCQNCRQNFIPINYKDTFVCVENPYFTFLASAPVNPNCSQYAYITNTWTCVRCNAGYLLDAGNCVTSCPGTKTLYLNRLILRDQNGDTVNESFYIDKARVCDTLIAGCKTAYVDLNRTSASDVIYTCIECLPGFINYIDSNNYFTLYRNPLHADLPVEFSPVSFYPSRSCLANATTNNILGDVIDRTANDKNFVEGCEFYADTNLGFGCTKCKHGFTGVVRDTIWGCKIYTEFNSCSVCNQGFYLKNPTMCVPVVLVAECAEYSPTATTTTCVRCTEDFLANITTCSPRSTLYFPNCITLSLTTDKCDACEDRFGLNDVKNCIRKIPECSTHNTAVTSPTCTACNNGFYLQGGECKPGAVDNCDVYTVNVENTCSTCQTGYFLKANQCILHLTISNCGTYSSSLDHTCQKCNESFYMFSAPNKCAAVVQVTNCAEYESLYKCKRCNATFYLDKYQKRCLSIPASTNCTTWVKEGTKCDQCNTGFFQIPNVTTAQCVNSLVYMFGNCSADIVLDEGSNQPNLISQNLTTLNCRYCNVPATQIPKDISLDYICLESTMLSTYNTLNPAAIFKSNCVRHEFQTPNWSCVECGSGYVLKLDTGTIYKCIKIEECVAESGNNIIISRVYNRATQNIKIAIENVCILNTGLGTFGAGMATTPATPYSLSNCYASPQANPTSTDVAIVYYCSSCFTGFIKEIPRGEANKNVSNDGSTNELPFGVLPAVNCIDSKKIMIFGDTNMSNLIPKCDIYEKTTATLYSYRCIKCVYGYSGKVYRDIGNNVSYIKECQSTITSSTNSPTLKGGVVRNDINSSTNYPPMSAFLSTIQCDTGIPVLVLSFASNRYSIDSYVNPNYTAQIATFQSTNDLDYFPPVFCSTTAVRGATTITFATAFANCAIVMINLAGPEWAFSVADDRKNLSCIACKPGYKPTYAISNPEIIVTCTQIPTATCASSVYFNACSTCQTGYAFKHNSDVISYDECLAFSNVHNTCFATGTDNACVYCPRGYSLNSTTKKCETAKPAQCSDFVADIVIPKVTGPLAYYLLDKLSKCTKCNNNYSLLKYSNTINILGLTGNNIACVTTDVPVTIATRTDCFGGNSTNQKLKNTVTLAYECTKCPNTFVLGTDGNCYANTNLPLCILTESDTVCNICIAPGTNLNVGGRCKVKANPQTDGANIPNCTTYDDAGSKASSFPKCSVCAEQYWLSSDGKTCTLYTVNTDCATFTVTSGSPDTVVCKTCKTNKILLNLKDNVQICLPTAIPISNCAALDSDQSKLGKVVCLTCIANFFPVNVVTETDRKNICHQIPLITNCAEYEIDTTLSGDSLFYATAGSTLKCKKCTPTFYLNNNACALRTTIVNCVTYSVVENLCTICAENYILNSPKTLCEPSPALNTTPSILKGFILNCRAFKNCKPTFYDGLNFYLAQFVSCHTCYADNEIPFVAVRGRNSSSTRQYDEIQGLNEYTLTPEGADAYDKGVGGQGNFCIIPQASSLSISDANFTFPTNCGVGVLNTNSLRDARDSNKTTGVNKDRISVFCGACKPGFRPTIATDNNEGPAAEVKYMIGSCTAIENCEFSRWFNNCSQCAPNYVYKYESNNVLYHTCILYTANPDCFAASVSGNTNTCVYCKKGTYKNKDGFCERIQAPRCEWERFSFLNIFPLTNLNTGLFLSSEGVGCTQCDQGFVGIQKTGDHWVCTESFYHSKGPLPDSTLYIKNCKNYYVDDTGLLKCNGCTGNFIPIFNSNQCVSNSGLSNCLVASNSTQCRECSSDYVLVNRLCDKKNIANCILYANNDTSIEQICSDCASGYYLEGNVCKLGGVKNCLLYETFSRCNKCFDGFALVKRNDGFNYCYPVNSSLNCKSLDTVELQKGNLLCTECGVLQKVPVGVQGFFKNNLCMRFSEIANCSIYDLKPAIGDSSFGCLECQSEYYLNNGQCLFRTIINENCLTYNKTTDQCTKCKDGYYINTAGNSCETYPTGVKFCIRYTDEKTCTRCDSNFYLAGGLCVAVIDSGKVTNCLYYASSGFCEVCNPAFFLDAGKCITPNALNCATFSTVNACKTCALGLGLQEDKGIINCVQKNLQNCFESNDSAPFKCKVCIGNFFPNVDGICTSVSTAIKDCVVYETNDFCSKCTPGTALSFDKKGCLNIPRTFAAIDLNCVDAKITDAPACNICNPGYYFGVGGNCTECVGAILNNGCLHCDATNTTNCLICKSGFSHTINGTCLDNNLIITNNTNPTTNNTNTTGNNTNNTNTTGNNTNTTNGIGMISIIGVLLMFFRLFV